MTLFFLINFVIGSYFALTVAALFSPKALNLCAKMYDQVDYSIDNHRVHWMMGCLMASGYYCYLWGSTW